MFFRWQYKGHLMLLFLTQCLYSSTLFAEKLPLNSATQAAALQAKPQKCVTLNEGRTCFASITFTWQTHLPAELCLIEKSSNKLIQCFKKNADARFIFEFESHKTISYQLVNEQKNVLAETKIEVNWVYESSPRKRRWRVF